MRIELSRGMASLALAIAGVVGLGTSGPSMAGAAVVPGTTVQPNVWLKADAITGVADGGSLRTWADSSGNGRDASQTSNFDRQPQYHANGIAPGVASVRFNLDQANVQNEFLALPGALANTAASNLDLFVVARDSGTRSVNPNARAITVNTRTNSSQANGFFLGYGSTPLVATYAHVGNTNNTQGGSQQVLAFRDSGVNLSTLSRSALNSEFSTYDDLGSSTSTVDWSGFTPSNLTTTQIGTEGGIHYFFGDIAEIIAFETTLSDADRTAVVSYLGEKYAIASAVPEPTAAVGLIGLAGLFMSRRRSR